VVILAAAAACTSRTPTERERALDKLPSQARLIAAADGSALSAFRPVVDATRPFLPEALECVVDAALTSEAAALAVAPRIGTTIVLVTRAHVARCPALSRIAPDTFVATLGAGAPAARSEDSPRHDPRWARALPYLEHDPVAIAIDTGELRAIASAQPRPPGAWLAIDAADVAGAARGVRTWLDRERTTALRTFVDNLNVTTRGSQLLVRASKLRADELALVAVDVLRALEAPPPRTAAPLPCPAPGAGIVRCTNGTHLVVRSLAATLRELAEVASEPAVAGGDVVGIRLSEDPEVLLRRGDVILGLDGHRIISAAQLHDLAGTAHDRSVLAVRRDGRDIIFELSE
jgi:hypothetical protein